MSILKKGNRFIAPERGAPLSEEFEIQDSTIFQSPIRLVLLIGLCVFLGEASVMIFLSYLQPTPIWFEALFDSSMLILLLSPVLYLFVYSPFVQNINKLNLAELVLQKANKELENRVAERTAELKASEEQLLLITDNLPVLISYVDSDLRYHFNNKVYEEWFKRPREEFNGRHIQEILGKENFEKIKDHIEEALSGRAANYESFISYEDGKTRYVNSTFIPDFNDSGEVKGLFTLVTDITESERANQELVDKATELREANAELSQYAYVVSHDLKAPLRAINNYASFLRKDIRLALENEHKEYLDALGHAVQEANELVQALLEFSHIGRGNSSFERIATGTFLKELIISLSLPDDVKITMVDDWPTIEADSILLRQVFQNLIDNAVKFNDSAQICIELGWRQCSDGRYEFAVSDNGLGIEPRYREQIFRVFERLHTRKDYGGTGIGLAIVKKAASILGGMIRVESKLGEGSTFIITLPKTQEPRQIRARISLREDPIETRDI
jgi:PAS domain S-box-containing protein